MKDDYGRHIDYLRISLTDRCNFRCVYCMPAEGVNMISHRDILSYEEILKVVEIAGKMGISKIRLTGGEPLVRKGLLPFIKNLKSISTVESISMTTNGFLLKDYASQLKKSGLDRINISLDTLDSTKFLKITRRDGLQQVLEGIDCAVAAGLNPVKINTVIVGGTNDDEILPLVRYAGDKGLLLRFIEQMPFNNADRKTYMPAEKIMEIVASEYGNAKPADSRSHPLYRGFGPSEIFQFGQDGPVLGFISPVSNHFCSRCNRMRLTADGKLKPCLLSNEEIDLKASLRGDGDNRDLEGIIRYAVEKKPEGHNLKKYGLESIRGMSKIGG